MGISLQDQLLKAGLVDKKKASEVRKEKQKRARQRVKKGQAKPVDEAKQAAREVQKAQVERDRQLNLERKAAAEKRALEAQIRQLIEINQVPLDEGDIDYSFSDAGKVKKLLVNEDIQSRLSRGKLAIARFDERYAVLPIGVADKIQQRDQETIVLRNDVTDAPDEDDPYAEFQVPDDLMW